VNLRNDRLVAEQKESVLQCTSQDQKQKGSDISNVLAAVKKENGIMVLLFC
jgi:hypothetical protein